MAGVMDFHLNLLANTTGLQQGMNGAKFAVTALVAAMAAVGVGLSVQGLVQAADSYTNLSARINIATKEGGDFNQAMAGVQQIALATNSNLSTTADLFTRLNAVGKDMGMTQQQTLDLTKTVTQAIQIGGGSAEAAEGAVTQFIQAMQGGVLRGEEFNSIMEGGYGLAEALAKGLGVTTGELRKMAEAGELSSERVVKAIGSQAASVQATYDQFPTTIGNALQRISTSWEILIGKMDQANGASAMVAQWLVALADNIQDLDFLLEDVGEGFVWVGDQLKKIDPATINALKIALTSAYDALKSLGSTVRTAFEAVVGVINTVLSQLFTFGSSVDTAQDKTNGFTKVLQVINIAIGALSDGFAAIGIAVNLFVGALYSAASAWANLVSKFTWGSVKEEAIANMRAMKAEADKHYKDASDGALNFKSKAVEAIEEVGKTQKQIDADAVASSKAKLDQLLADQKTETDGKKSSEEEKLKAVQEYAEAAIAANGGVMSGAMQADLISKGYIVTLDALGKVSASAWEVAKTGAENTAISTDKARKAATALGLDLDVSLNRVSQGFKASEVNVLSFANGVEALGIKGRQAGEVTYEAWLKWLETAKSQAEIDLAKQKLNEFGEQGKLSTGQVEQGLIAVKLQAQELPEAINPVTEAFKRLGIETKENLKLAAQQAKMDYITVRDSGQATADGIQKAYERAAQAAVASGDAAVIASINAVGAGRNLQIQTDETGRSVVTSTDQAEQSINRLSRAVSNASSGFRGMAQEARNAAEEIKSTTDARNDALTARSEAQAKERSESSSSKAVGGSFKSYNKAEVLAELKNMGYDDKQAQKLAGSIMSAAFAKDKDTMQKNMGTGNAAYLNAAFDKLLSQGLTASGGSIEVQKRLAALANGKGSVSVSTPTPSEPASTRRIELVGGGTTANISGSASDLDAMEKMLSEFEMLKKGS